MVSQKLRTRMRDYIAERLRSTEDEIDPQDREIARGIVSSLIIVNRNKAAILIDQPYPKDSLNDVRTGLGNRGIGDIAYIFYKDGKTFFRSSVAGEFGDSGLKSVRFKKWDLSLKNYGEEDLRKMITFRPEERFAFSFGRGIVQYYQPKSERLEEGIVSYTFEPVILDRTHLASRDFGYGTEESKRLHIWKKMRILGSPAVVKDGLLRDGLMIPDYEPGYFG